MPLKPGKETFHQPASFVSPQASAVLRLGLHAILSVRRDHLDTLLPQLLIQLVAVVGAVADQIFRLRLDHVELETQLHQRDFMMVRRMRADRQRQAMTIHNCHDFHAFSAFCRADLRAAALGRGKRGIDKALRLIQRAFIAQRVRKVGHDIAQHFIAASVLKAAMHRFVIRVALRQHVPLRASVENPENGFEDLPRGNRLAASATRRNVFLRKVIPDTFPVLVVQP